jgi:hypothetical protein
VTRVNAIRAVAALPADRLVRAMTDSVASLPEDYERQKLLGWITANLRVRQHGDGAAGAIASTADLDLRKAVTESLSKAGTELARELLQELLATDPAPPGEASGEKEPLSWRLVPLLNSVFRCPGDLTVWVSRYVRERPADGMTWTTLIHGNQFDDSQGVGEASSMLSGGLSATQGTEAEIFEDVVFPCLRGEQPRFPVTAAMGETVHTQVENGRTVTQGRRLLDGAGEPAETD